MEPPHLTRGEPRNFRCSCPWGVGRIQAIDVKADIKGLAPHLPPHVCHQRDQRLHPAVLGQDHPEALAGRGAERWAHETPIPPAGNHHPHFTAELGRNGRWGRSNE